MGNRVVYQPAYEAEVEYLESTGKQYIDTGVITSSELGIIAHIAVMNDNTTYLFGGADGLYTAEYGFMAVTAKNKSSFRFNAQSSERPPLNIGVNYEFDNTSNHNILTVGKTSYQTQLNEFVSSFNFYLFAENRSGTSWKGAGVRIYDFKIYSGSTLVRDFIPVRIGSTGYMYDKVTKQLFANKGTRQFILGSDVVNAVIPQQRCVLYFGNQRSVIYERIYEEYEWLKGDGSAYINTGIIVNSSTLVLSITSRASSSNGALCGSRNGANLNPDTTAIHYQNGRYRLDLLSVSINNYVWVNKGNLEDTFDIDLASNTAVVNGTSFTSSKTHTNSINTFRVFGCFGANVGYSGYINKFILNDSYNNLNLIPVKLLQSIPAILDGNGIARQVGERGMWDKVNDKFYGNVGSGSFTVSND